MSSPLALALLVLLGALPGDPARGVEPPPIPLAGASAGPAGLRGTDLAGLREARERARHRVRPVGAGHLASNPGQQWTTRFDGRGFTTTPDAGDWRWGLQLQGSGCSGQITPVTSPRSVTVEADTIAYVWDDQLTEWFVNDRRGLEHGFTVHEHPACSTAPGEHADLVLTLAVRGALKPQATDGGRGVRFVDHGGTAVVTYSGLTVFDADGRSLPAQLAAVPVGLQLSVDARGARYPLTIDPIAQQAYLKASNSDENDAFGQSVAVSGDTVVVGAPSEASGSGGVGGDQADDSEPGAGAAYVFVRDGSTWSQQIYLKPSDPDGISNPFVTPPDGDEFGAAVAISGDTLVVGAPGEDSGATGVNGNPTDDSVPQSGAAFVFVRSGTSWIQQAYLKASNTGAGDLFGGTVAIEGNTIVVGAGGEDSGATGVDGDGSDESASQSGAAYVFTRSGTSWSQQAYLKASNTDAGDGFGATNVTAFSPRFSHKHGGQSVAVSGDTVVVGARGEDSAATGVDGDGSDDSAGEAGAAYVFTRSGSSWSQQAYLKASNTDAGDHFGSAATVWGDTVVVGARYEASAATGVDGDQADDSANDAGAAYAFVRAGTSWSQQAYLKASNTGGGVFPPLAPGDEFGQALALSGNTLVVGALFEASAATGVDGDQADDSTAGAGAAYVFARSGTSWSQQDYLKASNTDAQDVFGASVAVSGDTIVVGAYNESSAATGVDGDQADDSTLTAGAAYAFRIEPPECFLVIGDAPGDAAFLDAGHLFQTQLDVIHESHAVLMESIPDFALPGRWALASAGAQGGQGAGGAPVGPPGVPEWLWDGEFAVQVLLWNPSVFPALPEQCSHGLWVRIAPGGGVLTRPFGAGTGLQVWAEADVDASGQPVVRFPFDIPGL